MFIQSLRFWVGALGLVLSLGYADAVWGGDPVCSVVRIEIRQELTLERQAFDAHMRIVNGLDTTALENVEINVWFLDAQDNPVLASSNPDSSDALFFITMDHMSGVTGIDGSGTINAGGQADIHWLIIPAPGAGGQQSSGELYQVGATLSYSFGGESETIEVAPDFIQVRPMPILELDYFLPEEVIGNDPLTPEVEPSVPFELGVRVTNSGYGKARNLAIESAQPEIVENLQGLLINFELLDTQVNDRPVVNSLLADFGDLAPGQSAVAIWRMSTSLYGHFISFEADYYHSDALGGELTSLIDRIDTHTLIRSVLNDLPGRDSVRDFLAIEGMTIRLYESEGINTPVTDQSGNVDIQQIGSEPGVEYYRLIFPETLGPVYAVLPDPTGGAGTITSVWRADGKLVPESNFWQSRSKESGAWESLFHVFDTNSSGHYEIVAQVASPPNRPPHLDPIGNQELTAGEVLQLTFSASDPDGDPLTFEVVPLPGNAQLDDSGSGQAHFTWSTNDSDVGSHVFTVSVSDGEFQVNETFQVEVIEHSQSAILVEADEPIEIIKGETSAALTVQLASSPAEDVWVPIASSDEDAGTLLISGVTFTSEDWNEPRAISVHAPGANYYQGEREFEILIGPSESADPDYHGLGYPPLVAVNRDPDSARLMVTPVAGLATAGEGTIARFEARLNGPPSAAVSVFLESSHPDFGQPEPSVLVIEPEEWNEPVEVIVRGQAREDEMTEEMIYLIAAVLTESADSNFAETEMEPIEVIHRAGNTWGIEAGRVTLPAVDESGEWTTIEFGQPFRQVPVVVWIGDDGEADPSAVRIRNVGLESFEAVQVEPPSSHGFTQETEMHFLAVEPGVHPLPFGGMLEAKTVTTGRTQAALVMIDRPDGNWEPVDFDVHFFSDPVFLAGIQSTNNESAEVPHEGSRPWLTVAVEEVHRDGARVALERSRLMGGRVEQPETIGYVAITPGYFGFSTGIGRAEWHGQLDSALVSTWAHGCSPFTWFTPAPDQSVLLAHQLTRRNRLGGWVRLCTDGEGHAGLILDNSGRGVPVGRQQSDDVRGLWVSQPFFSRLLGWD
jgi:hypothetical protein